MVDPITIGIAISSAKMLIDKAVEVKDIAGALDNLFHAQEGKPVKVKHKKPTTRMQQLLRMKAGDADYDDETSISSVANDILVKKQNEIALRNLGREIDRKWGLGTFELITDEREKRLAEKKIAEDKSKEKAKRSKEKSDEKWDKAFNYMIEFGKVILVFAAAGILVYSIWINRCVEKVC